MQALGLDDFRPLGVRLAGRGQLGDPPLADDDVVDGVDPGHRVEHRRPAQDEVRVLAGARVEGVGEAHAGCPIGVGAAPSPSLTGIGASPPASSS